MSVNSFNRGPLFNYLALFVTFSPNLKKEHSACSEKIGIWIYNIIIIYSVIKYNSFSKIWYSVSVILSLIIISLGGQMLILWKSHLKSDQTCCHWTDFLQIIQNVVRFLLKCKEISCKLTKKYIIKTLIGCCMTFDYRCQYITQQQTQCIGAFAPNSYRN